jgi:hypothetical protein
LAGGLVGDVDELVGAELELPDEPLPGPEVAEVGLFLGPLDPHALTAISTASAPTEQARLLAMCTHSR